MAEVRKQSPVAAKKKGRKETGTGSAASSFAWVSDCLDKSPKRIGSFIVAHHIIN